MDKRAVRRTRLLEGLLSGSQSWAAIDYADKNKEVIKTVVQEVMQWGANQCFPTGKKDTGWQGEMLLAGLRDKQVEQSQVTAYSSEGEDMEIRGGSL